MYRVKCVILLIAIAVLFSCSAASAGGGGADKTLTFYSDPALDGGIAWSGASTYTRTPGDLFVSIG